MKKKRYAIIDVETTGGQASRDKVIEIGIAIHDGEKVIDTFETLIHPERTIPYGITDITGITNEMVVDAPKFYEVAKKVVEITEGAIFVAHNARFDYGFIREEFKRLGYTYSRRMLCTVRLGRQTIPGLPSYSLSSIIRYLNINVKNRHRAMGDVLATVEFFEHILAKENSEESVHKLVNLGLKESQLPDNITLDKLHTLPEEPGVYYLLNKKKDVVYVGKSINIKKRVMEHFAQITEKARKLQQRVHDISWELTGSELVALLLESHEIKRLRPPINRAQRVRNFPYVIFQYEDTKGYLCMDVARTNAKERKKLEVVAEYPKASNAKAYLKKVIEDFSLCNRLCGMDSNIGNCFYYQIKLCKGACAGEESAAAYNARATQAIEALKINFEEDFFIVDQGRNLEERAVVFVENGCYRGFGYIDLHNSNDKTELANAIKTYQSNPETIRIIRRFLNQNKTAKKIVVRKRTEIR